MGFFLCGVKCNFVDFCYVVVEIVRYVNVCEE